MTVLAADEAIKARISHKDAGLRIYLGRVPEGVEIEGGVIVVGKTGSEHDYGLVDETGSKFTTLQIDAYDLRPQDAESLAELVAGVISGEPAIGLTAGDHFIESSLIAGEHSEYQRPIGASDDWRPRGGRDYRIHHTL